MNNKSSQNYKTTTNGSLEIWDCLLAWKTGKGSLHQPEAGGSSACGCLI